MNSKLAIKKRVMAQILPVVFVKYFFYILLSLFFSPLILLFFLPEILKESFVLEAIIFTESIAFIILSILGGIIFVSLKSPYTEEIKTKLGYIK